MPTFEITAPDGNVYEVTAPEGVSEQEVLAYAQQNYQSAQEPQEKINKAEGGLRSFTQGTTFGFGDEITAGLAAIPSSLITGNSISDSYNQILDDERRRIGEFREQAPITSATTEIGGALATGIGSLGTKAGASVASSLGRGGLGARVAKGAAAGATSGGLYGFGTGEGEKRLESAGQGALLGGATGGAFPLAGRALSKVGQELPSAQDIKTASQRLYTSARQKGAAFTDDAVEELKSSVQRQITSDDFAKDIIGADEVTDLLDRLGKAQGKEMTLESFEALDKNLGNKANIAFAKGDADLSRRLGEIQGDLRNIVTSDNFVKGSSDAVKYYRKATDMWRNYAKMRDIENILENAEYYVGGEAAGIKAGFTRLAKNKKLLRGYTPDEVKAIQKAAKTGATEGLLRTLSSRLMTIGGAVSGGVPGAIAGQAASSAARAGASALKGADATRVGRLIAQKTGLPMNQSQGLLSQIMKMPPKQAQEALRNITQSTSITQGTK